MRRKNDTQFSLTLPEPPRSATVDDHHIEMPPVRQAELYSFVEAKAEKGRMEDAAHFEKILRLVKHFK
jgi:hypothetical protein